MKFKLKQIVILFIISLCGACPAQDSDDMKKNNGYCLKTQYQPEYFQECYEDIGGDLCVELDDSADEITTDDYDVEYYYIDDSDCESDGYTKRCRDFLIFASELCE